MEPGLAEFESRVAAVLRRWWAQQELALPEAAAVAGFAGRLSVVVQRRGLPRPLGAAEIGQPGGMSDAEFAPLVREVVGDLAAPLFSEAARQMVKTCFYPEFRVCRDSFRETTSDGVCRRQQLERTRRRLSGVHCVDCPHWVELSADEHQRYVAAEWHGDPAVFFTHCDVFLPEDFRSLRQWLHARARSGG